MTIYAKIKNFLLISIILIIIIFTSVFDATAQRYSTDKAPEKKIKFNIHLRTLFKSNEHKKAVRQKKKDQRKSSRNEIKEFKKYWKKADHPKELGTKKKVVKRMKKNLRLASRINHNKHKDNAIKRLSRKKIKLPKIFISKIHWPWTKKSSNE